jgi:hypothetical protein
MACFIFLIKLDTTMNTIQVESLNLEL